MKYLQTVAAAYGYTIRRGSSYGYNGYHMLNRHGLSVGMFFNSLASVAEFLAKKIKRELV